MRNTGSSQALYQERIQTEGIKTTEAIVEVVFDCKKGEKMDNFNAIYKILTYIEKNMDYEEFDEKHFTADFFKISETRFFFLLRALIDDGYITGVKCEEIAGGKMVALISPRLTLAGMEYLVNNTMMKKAYRLAKGIKDIMPCV